MTVYLSDRTALTLETNGDHYALEIGYSNCTGDSADASGFC